MNHLHRHVLHGCTSRPWASYLRALGVLRAVGRQVDPGARGAWSEEGFVLWSRLDRRNLEDFFLRAYRLTPLLSPWNKDFKLSWDGRNVRFSEPSVQRLLQSTGPRFELAREALQAICKVAERLAPEREPGKESPVPLVFEKEAKDRFIVALRGELPDEVVPLFDTLYIVRSGGPTPPPFWGSGGNDGRMEFSLAYVEALLGSEKKKRRLALFEPSGEPRPEAHLALREALWGEVVAARGEGSPGQIDPVAVGGANLGTGSSVEASRNPWSFVLAAEGSALLAGAVSRRLASAYDAASAPFTVRSSPAGAGSLALGEEVREEAWMPMWRGAASVPELEALFGEGRVRLGRRTVGNARDFVRALASLGADRGLDEFERFGFVQRNGRSFLTVSLGRHRAWHHPHIALLDELDPWTADIESRVRSTKPPPSASLKSAWRRYEDAVFAWSSSSDRAVFRDLMLAVGELERAIAPSRSAGESPVRPLSELSWRWAHLADDGSREFELACALASLHAERHGSGRRLDGLREAMEPVARHLARDGRLRRVAWDQAASVDVVWRSADLAGSMVDVLHRRMLHSSQWGPVSEGPALGALSGERAERGASLRAVHDWLQGATSDASIDAWLRCLSLVNWPRAPRRRPSRGGADPLLLDPLYALVRLVFSGGALRDRSGAPVPEDPVVLRLLEAGRAEAAAERAARRLRAAGYQPMVRRVPASAERARRVAAALLIPLWPGEMAKLARLVLPHPPRWGRPMGWEGSEAQQASSGVPV